jgi:Fur family ferric uptake transcriptional regulator
MSVDDLLRNHGLKKTTTRKQVLDIYLNTDHALAVADVEEALGDGVDRVTLYRTMGTFEEKGLLHKVYDDDGKLKFSLCSPDCSSHQHHDNHLHFHCRKCGKTTCIENVAVPEVEGLEGFDIQDVYMVANGTCKDCIQAA